MQTHLPGYITDYDKLTKAGAQVIVCVAVNDAFVMTAWGESAGAKGKVRLCLGACTLMHHLALQLPAVTCKQSTFNCRPRRDNVMMQSLHE